MSDQNANPSEVPAPADAKTEHLFHRYRTNAIPWYVRLIWVMFYVFAAYYIVQFLFPTMRSELNPSRPQPTAQQPE